MSEQPIISKEQMEAYQRQATIMEQVAVRQCVNDLVALAAERGFVIVAIPQITDDGRLSATMVLQRKAT